jgi:diacylglycerol kinase (ATP)
MPKPGKTGFARVISATAYSWAGLKAAFKHEAAFRQELFLCIVLAPIALLVARTGLERALLIGSLLLVLMVELLNSAIEAVVDRVSDEHHELAGRAKDIGSAAVFVSLLNVVVTWALVLT